MKLKGYNVLVLKMFMNDTIHDTDSTKVGFYMYESFWKTNHGSAIMATFIGLLRINENGSQFSNSAVVLFKSALGLK